MEYNNVLLMTVQAEQSIIMKSHIYLSSIKPENRTCFLCKIRKSMVCVKCGSCLLCHPFTERIEARKPGFCTGIAMLCDIESPALSEIKRWNSLSFGFRTPKCGCRVHSLATTTNSQGRHRCQYISNVTATTYKNSTSQLRLRRGRAPFIQ